MTRIPIRLTDSGFMALCMLARQEYRDVRQQAAWMIEQELKRLGLLVCGEKAVKTEEASLGGANATE